MANPRWDEWAGDEIVREVRRWIFEERLGAFAREHLGKPLTRRRALGARQVLETKGPPTRSILLTVAQYWNDNADDEVHLECTASPHETPVWPHDCYGEGDGGGDEDGCSLCAGVDWPVRGYGQLITGFEAFCHERGNQNQDEAENALPLAIARLRGDGEIAVEVVGRLVRPWLDLPRTPAPELPLDEKLRPMVIAARADAGARAVLADALLERGDPRGELMTLAAQNLAQASPEVRARHNVLLAEVGRAWLGAWDAVVPRAAVRWEGGLPTELGLWIESNEARWQLDRGDPTPFALARRVRFLPTSARLVWPGLAPVRAFGPVDDEGLEALGESDVPFAVEELEIEPSGPETIALLASVDDWLPRLRVVRLVGEQAGRALIPALSRFRGAARLARLEIANTWSEAEHAAEVASWTGAGFGIPVGIAQLDADTRCPSGWAITVEGDSATVERIGLLSSATDARRREIVAALPRRIRIGGYRAPD